MTNTDRVVGERSEVRVRTLLREHLRVPRSDHTTTLTLERSSDDGRTAAPGAAVDELVDELHELVRESNRDLLAHTKMVPI